MEHVETNSNMQGGNLHSANPSYPNTQTPNSKMVWFALILSILSLAGLFAVCHKLRTALDDTNQNLNTVQTQLLVNNKAINDLQDALDDQKAEITSFKQLSGGDAAAWHLAEAKYLVELANYQLTFTKDLPAALSLLQNADQQMAVINDPTYTPIRQLIANNIAELQAVPKTDYASILIRISALQTQVAHLPAIGLPKPTAIDTEDMSQLSPLRRAMHDSWVTLQKIIVIRKDDIGIQPLLSPEQQTYLQQNLQLILQQAQWAALRGQQDVYIGSLRQAELWVLHYFAKGLPATQAYLKGLNDLMQVNVQPRLPDLSPLAHAMQQISIPQAKQGN